MYNPSLKTSITHKEMTENFVGFKSIEEALKQNSFFWLSLYYPH